MARHNKPKKGPRHAKPKKGETEHVNPAPVSTEWCMLCDFGRHPNKPHKDCGCPCARLCALSN